MSNVKKLLLWAVVFGGVFGLALGIYTKVALHAPWFMIPVSLVLGCFCGLIGLAMGGSTLVIDAQRKDAEGQPK